MFGNYLSSALRSIARHKLYSFINIAGLAVGLTCVMFIILFVFPTVLGFFILHRNSVQTEQRYKAHPAAGQPVP